MRNLSIILFIVGISLSFHCAGDSGVLFDPSYWSSPYQGITVTDKFGFILKEDESDWCINQLSLDTNGSVVNNVFYAFFPAYPNPVDREKESIKLVFFTGQDSRIKLLIKDGDDKTVITLVDTICVRGLYEIEWDFKNQLGVKVPSGIYRCYMNAQDFTCQGDIWIK